MQVGDLILVLVFFALLVCGATAFIYYNGKRIERRRWAEQNRTAALAAGPWEPPRRHFTAFELRAMRTYRVVAPFLDHGRVPHEIGERWIFLRHAFLPYEDGLSLFVLQGSREIHIRLQCRE